MASSSPPAPPPAPTPAPPPAARTEPGESRVVLRGIDWPTYERLAELIGDQPVRMAYDRGVLELMSPSPQHERYKRLFARLLDDLLVGLRIRFEAAGESRWKLQAAAHGLEADDCYFLDPAKIAAVRGRPADRPDDPFPDLAIEVEITSSAVDKLAIYASLGVPEVWRFDGEDLKIHRLRPDGTYELRSESLFLPIQPEEVVDWIHVAGNFDQMEWSERVRDWIRDVVAPRLRGG